MTPSDWMVSFFDGRTGFEWPGPPSLAASQQFTLRPLRKHAGGVFLGRSRIHRFLNAPGTGVGRNDYDCSIVGWSKYLSRQPAP